MRYAFRISRRDSTHSKNVRLLTDHIGGDVVFVTKRLAMCEQVTQTNVSGVAFGEFDGPVIMARYPRIRGTDPDDLVELSTVSFGANRVDVNQVIAMCEGASKTIPG